jgi:hypothetical protein
MLARRWRLAVGLGIVFAAISAFIATRAEGEVGLHVGAVVHNYDTELFLPPH